MTITLEDRLAIAELTSRFAHCSDYEDWDGLAKLYVPEVVTELAGMPVKYEGIAVQLEHAREFSVQTQEKAVT